MSNEVIKTTKDLESSNLLLDMELPTYRQAYSDRASWLMACMSQLAYIRFNPLFSTEEQKAYFIENVEKLVKSTKKLSSLYKLIDVVGYDDKKEKETLESQLSSLRLELAKTFDKDGTQAILASSDKRLILAFRGTEPTSFNDVKSDLKSKMVACETSGFIHSGFKEAYEKVEVQIQTELNKPEHANKPLFITGHSLGGALATIATKRLTHNGGIAACYTYGGPRVGDKEWVSEFKPTIYRVVNAADVVTMVPPSGLTTSLICGLLKWIPYIGKPVSNFFYVRLGKYMHAGDMRYLTNCPKGDYSKVKRLFSVQWLYRIIALKEMGWPWKKLASDHSINIYRQKLQIIAVNNNSKS